MVHGSVMVGIQESFSISSIILNCVIWDNLIHDRLIATVLSKPESLLGGIEA